MKRIAYIILFLLSTVSSFAQLAPGTVGVLYSGQRTYATWSTTNKSSNVILSNGNLKYANVTPGQAGMGIATFGKSSGSWYWEVKADTRVAGAAEAIGVATIIPTSSDLSLIGATAGTFAVRLVSPGCVRYNNSFFGTCSGNYLTGTVIGIAFNITAGTLAVYRNNVLMYTLTGLPTGIIWYPACQSDANSGQYTANFGASAFTYTPPAGFNSGFYTE